MYRYERLLVVLRPESNNDSLISYAGLVARMAESKTVTFLLMTFHPNIPAEIAAKHPALSGPEDEQQYTEIRRRVKQFGAEFPGVSTSLNVLRGDPEMEALKWARKEGTDLILLSRKPNDKTSTSRAERITRKAPCSVLILPEGFRPDIRNIVVPVDFSEHSADALDVAIAFASAAGLPQIHVLNVYSVPIPAYTMGERYEQLAEDFKRWAQKHYQDFVGRANLRGVQTVPIFKHDPDTADAIEQVVREREMDLVVMGTRGTSLAVLLGSVTAQLIWNLEVPVVAVKKKGATLGLLDWLFGPKGQ